MNIIAHLIFYGCAFGSPLGAGLNPHLVEKIACSKIPQKAKTLRNLILPRVF
jgi:hypothetical protein